MINRPNILRTSLFLTLLSVALSGLVACGSGVTIDGDEWLDDTNLEQDAGFTDVNHPNQNNDTGPGPGPQDTSFKDIESNTQDDAISNTENDTNIPNNPFDNLPTTYPFDRVHSPITPYVAQHLRSVAELDPDLNNDVFSKFGDSLTVNTGFMHCFSSAPDLGDYAALQPTVDYFLAGTAGSTNPYIRTSLAAGVGWSAKKILDGLLDTELNATAPRYGLVMYGTNEIGSGTSPDAIYAYGENMLTIADKLLANGTIPVFTSIPWRGDKPVADLAVPRFNAVMRAVAQSRQVPFIDLSDTWAAQPGRGLLSDGIHINSWEKGCNFTQKGMTYAHNARNLATIQQLHRLRDIIDNNAQAPDSSTDPLHGDGSSTDPIVIPGIPFVDSRNTSTGGQSVIDAYPGCNATQNESGKEFIYRFQTDRAVRIRAFVIDRNTTDIDVHLLDHTATGQGCIARDNKQVIHDLQPGTYHFALDTFVSLSGSINSGEYLFILLEEPQ